MSKMIVGLLIFVIAGIGVYFITQGIGRESPDKAAQEKNSESQGKKVAGLNGDVLAGSSSPYVTFNKTDYDKTLAEGKIIFLGFYANWCPICREEAPNLKAGFDALQTDKVVGFRVNYNDTQTDEDEKKLAKEFGITYQHTKVILKNGKEISKSLESWDRETFLKEINSVL